MPALSIRHGRQTADSTPAGVAVAVAVVAQEADAAEQEKLNKIIDDKVQARLKKDPASTTTTNHTHSSRMSH